MNTYRVSIEIDMIKIEDRGAFKSVLWMPFDKDTALIRQEFILSSIVSIEDQVRQFANDHDSAAMTRAIASQGKFNGYRCWAKLLPGQKKPRGWLKSSKLKLERQLIS